MASQGSYERSNATSTRQSTKNPIALRLYKVLGTNYEDDALRESLNTLSQFYDTPNELDTPKLPPNVAFVRKNLERDLQIRLETGAQQFLKAFEIVDQNLTSLESCINDMYTRCDEVETQLRTTSEACSSLLSRVSSLRTERQAVEVKHAIASQFLRRFTLTDREIEALNSRELQLTEEVFEALARTKQIKEDCAVLLREGTEESKAGLDIMSMCTTNMDAGFQKLHRHAINELRHLASEAYPEVDSTLQRTVELLRDQPELLQNTITTLAELRQSTLMDGFIVALTRGGPGGVPRPIELHAHDPARYTGDMLAWVHQTVAWEHEFLESLFGIKQSHRMMGSIRKPAEDPDTQEKSVWIAQILDAAVQGLCKPLKYRVLQTIKSQEDSVITYKITNLLRFYLVTMTRTIGETAFLSQTLNELFEGALGIFFDILESRGRSSLRFLHPPEATLSVPIVVINAAQNLRELMLVYETSLTGDEDENQKIADFRRILSVSVEPVIEACHRMADLNSSNDASKDDWANHVFLLNCFAYIQETLRAFSFAKEKVEQLEGLQEIHVNHLTEQHYRHLLAECGLLHLYLALEEKDDETPLSRTDAGTPTSVVTALSEFANFLKNLDVISSPRLTLLTAPRLPGVIYQDALRRICTAYASICEAAKDPSNRYEFAGTMLGRHRPFGQITTLKQLLGLSQDNS